MRLYLIYNDGIWARPLGSGFVTNKKGLFISVGHNLKNHQDDLKNVFAVFPDDGDICNLYKTRIYHHEYVDPRREGGNRIKGQHLDLIIGRILLYDLKKYYKIETKRPSEAEALNLIAFENIGDHRYRIQNNKVDFTQLTRTDLSLTIKHRDFGIISNDQTDYQIDPKETLEAVRYYNCLLLNNDESEGHKGNSGGPIINIRNKAVGIMLGGNPDLNYFNMLCAKYIRKKYKSINKFYISFYKSLIFGKKCISSIEWSLILESDYALKCFNLQIQINGNAGNTGHI